MCGKRYIKVYTSLSNYSGMKLFLNNIISSENPAFGGFSAFPSPSSVNMSHAEAGKIFRRVEQPILFVECSDLGYAVKLPSLTGDSFVARNPVIENASISNAVGEGSTLLVIAKSFDWSTTAQWDALI